MNSTVSNFSNDISAAKKLAGLIQLLKPRLSMLVAFSSAFGYYLGVQSRIDWNIISMLFIGGFLVSGSAVTVNQFLERKYDKIMKRTQKRPIPSGVVSPNEALIFSGLCAILGLTVLWIYTNPLTTVLSFVSLILYAFVYTPLKRVGPVAVLVGAIPGALPPLLGWTAATGSINYMGLIIFGIQFIWQFPHFWAIAWVADDDYKKAGFRLLPNNGNKDLSTAFQIMIYTLFLLPISLLPAKFGLTGINSAFIAVLCGTLFLAQTFTLMKNPSRKSAMRIMLASFIYLPIIQISFMLDKL